MIGLGYRPGGVMNGGHGTPVSCARRYRGLTPGAPKPGTPSPRPVGGRVVPAANPHPVRGTAANPPAAASIGRGQRAPTRPPHQPNTTGVTP